MIVRFVGFLLLLVAAAPAAAGEVSAPNRFALAPAEAGVFRLDAATGEVSFCLEKDGAPVCVPAPEATAGGGATSERDRIAALEERIAALEARAGSDSAVAQGKAMGRVKVLAERMMRRVVGLVREMKGEPGREDL